MMPVGEIRLGDLFGDFFARMEQPIDLHENARRKRGFHRA
jgi:hypothetical protein